MNDGPVVTFLTLLYLDDLAFCIRAGGGEVMEIFADLSNEGECLPVYRQVRENYGDADVLAAGSHDDRGQRSVSLLKMDVLVVGLWMLDKMCIPD